MVGTSAGRVRGGRDQFSWESIKTDKYRQNYLGHSLMAPVGKWQEGKDLIWYSKEKTERKDGPISEEQLKLQSEIIAVRQKEAELLGSTINPVLSSVNPVGRRQQQISSPKEEGSTKRISHDKVDNEKAKTQEIEKNRKRKREHESSNSKFHGSSSSKQSRSTHVRKDLYDEGRREFRSHSRHSHR